jgi:hypothetical protein
MICTEGTKLFFIKGSFYTYKSTHYELITSLLILLLLLLLRYTILLYITNTTTLLHYTTSNLY